jgi:prophage DNA circulation protein
VDQVDEIVKRAEVRFKTAHEALTRVVSTLESNVAYLTRIVAGLGEKFEKFGAVLEGCSLFKADSPKEGSEGAPKSGESTE